MGVYPCDVRVKPFFLVMALVMMISCFGMNSANAACTTQRQVNDAYAFWIETAKNTPTIGLTIRMIQERESAYNSYIQCKIQYENYIKNINSFSGSSGTSSSGTSGCNYNGKYYASCDEANRQYQIDLDNYNKALAASSSGTSGCNYNGKYYASCDEANRQYQIDVDNYNKALAASNSASGSGSQTQWQCAGKTFSTQAEAQAYCDELNRSSSATSGSATNQDKPTCPKSGDNNPDHPKIFLIPDQSGKITLRVDATKSSGIKKPTEYVIELKRISNADRALILSKSLTKEAAFEKSPFVIKGSFNSEKDHSFVLEGIIDGVVKAIGPCGASYAYVDTADPNTYDWKEGKWGNYVGETGPSHYIVWNYNCPASDKEFKDFKVSLDFDEKGPVYKIEFSSTPPRGMTVTVSLGYRNASNLTRYSSNLLTNGEAINRTLRVPQDSSLSRFDILTYLIGACGDHISVKIVGDEYKVLTHIGGISRTMTIEQLEQARQSENRVCSSNSADAGGFLTEYAGFLSAYQASAAQTPSLARYVLMIEQIKMDNSAEFKDLTQSCPKRTSIDKLKLALSTQAKIIKEEIKSEELKAKNAVAAAKILTACNTFNSDLGLAILQANNAGYTYPAISSALASLRSLAPSEFNCKDINVLTFDSDLLKKQSELLAIKGGIIDVITKFEAGLRQKKARVSIMCVKGESTKKVTAVNPKCPVGYKKK